MLAHPPLSNWLFNPNVPQSPTIHCCLGEENKVTVCSVDVLWMGMQCLWKVWVIPIRLARRLSFRVSERVLEEILYPLTIAGDQAVNMMYTIELGPNVGHPYCGAMTTSGARSITCSIF